MGGTRPGSAPPRAASIRAARAPSVGASNSARSGSSTPSGPPRLARRRVPSSECPPQAKKSSSGPKPEPPSSSLQISARISSVGVRGPGRSAPGRSTRRGAMRSSAATCRRSAVARRGRPESRRSGSSAAAVSRWTKPAASRSTASAVNRSRLCSITPASPPPGAAASSIVRSSFAVPVSTASGAISTPGSSRLPGGAFCSTRSTWTSGAWPGVRSGASSSTSLSNGSSCRRNAASVVAFIRSSSAANGGSPERSARSTRVFTNRPRSGSTSTRPRLAAAVPSSRSSVPASRPSSAASAAASTMNGLAPRWRASSWSAAVRVGERSNGRRSPAGLHASVVGRSAGRSSRAGAPSSSARAAASCTARASPLIQERCQRA